MFHVLRQGKGNLRAQLEGFRCGSACEGLQIPSGGGPKSSGRFYLGFSEGRVWEEPTVLRKGPECGRRARWLKHKGVGDLEASMRAGF